MPCTHDPRIDLFIESFHADPEAVLIATLEALADVQRKLATQRRLNEAQADAITALHNLVDATRVGGQL